jgi:hypothetical protein
MYWEMHFSIRVCLYQLVFIFRYIQVLEVCIWYVSACITVSVCIGMYFVCIDNLKQDTVSVCICTKDTVLTNLLHTDVQIHTDTCDKYKYIQKHSIQAIYIQINTNTYRYIPGTHSPGPALKFNWRLLIHTDKSRLIQIHAIKSDTYYIK